MNTRRIGRVRRREKILEGEFQDDLFLAETGERLPLESVRIVCPVRPSKIVAVALNWRLHAQELGKELPPETMFFTKPLSALIGPGDAIELPPDSENVHHEGEMGLVVGRRLKRATEAEAREAVLGVTCVNDVTARDVQRRQKHYTRSKGYDTFCPVGPWVVTGLDPTDLRVQVRVNGETRQDGRTRDMLVGPYALLAYISQVMTLEPGDVVSTGTPAGVGPVVAGDVVEVEVEGVGVLRNPVVGS